VWSKLADTVFVNCWCLNCCNILFWSPHRWSIKVPMLLLLAKIILSFNSKGRRENTSSCSCDPTSLILCNCKTYVRTLVYSNQRCNRRNQSLLSGTCSTCCISEKVSKSFVLTSSKFYFKGIFVNEPNNHTQTRYIKKNLGRKRII